MGDLFNDTTTTSWFTSIPQFTKVRRNCKKCGRFFYPASWDPGINCKKCFTQSLRNLWSIHGVTYASNNSTFVTNHIMTT